MQCEWGVHTTWDPCAATASKGTDWLDPIQLSCCFWACNPCLQRCRTLTFTHWLTDWVVGSFDGWSWRGYTVCKWQGSLGSNWSNQAWPHTMAVVHGHVLQWWAFRPRVSTIDEGEIWSVVLWSTGNHAWYPGKPWVFWWHGLYSLLRLHQWEAEVVQVYVWKLGMAPGCTFTSLINQTHPC